MQQYVLLLGANQYLRERSLSGAKQVTNLPIWTADQGVAYSLNRYFDGTINVDPQDADTLLKSIHAHELQGWTPKAVIPLNDWTLAAAHTVNRALGLPSMDATTILRSRNKYLMKEVFAKYGVPTAPFVLIETEADLMEAIETVGLPVVIKPYDFGGSGGVYLAKTVEEARARLRDSMEMMDEYRQQFGIAGNKFLVEKFIASRDEVSVEVLCFDGQYQVITVTEKYLSPEPWFAEMAHLVPSHRIHDRPLLDMAIHACKALKLSLGMAHVEIKILDGQGWVIEVGARPGGDGIMDQIERAYDFNPYAAHVKAYLGESPFDIVRNITPQRTAAIAFLKAPPGIITDIRLPTKLHDCVRSLAIQASVGKVSEPPIAWRAREGVVEYTWPHLFTSKPDEPTRLTEALSQEIFVTKSL